MTKQLNRSARIQSYGGKNYEKRAYALIGFSSNIDNDSTIQLIRGEVHDIPRMLRYWGDFTDREINDILELDYSYEIRFDDNTLVIRIS